MKKWFNIQMTLDLKAMNSRDRIKTIEKSQIKTGIDLATNEDIDIFAIANTKQKAVIVRMFLGMEN